MPVLVKKGSFVLNDSVGTQVVTGVGFPAKAILFFLTAATTDDDYASDDVLSVSIGSGPQFFGNVSVKSLDSLSPTSEAATGTRADICFAIVDHFGVAITEVDYTSTNPDGFTLEILVSDANSYIVHYLALGGPGITNASMIPSNNWSTSTGLQSFSGFGFSPDLLIVLNPMTTASEQLNLTFGLGAATRTQQVATAYKVTNDAAISQATSYQRTDRMSVGIQNAPGDTIGAEASFVRMDKDGFTWNVITAPSVAVTSYILALKGGNYWVGADTQKTSTGTKAKTGVGFSPKGLLLFGAGKTASAAIDSTLGTMSIGASDGTRQGAAWAGDVDGRDLGVVTTLARHIIASNNLLIHADGGADQARANFSSFDPDGFTLDWITADAVAREFLAIAIGDEKIDKPAKRETTTFQRW